MIPRWSVLRPNVLVVACSDGRLQQQTDAFLAHDLGVTGYDRFYLPGGAGALSASGCDFIRAAQMRQECRYLIELHHIPRVILLFHGPSAAGPADAVCADYQRKIPHVSIEMYRGQQSQDAHELLESRRDWAGRAEVAAYRCEVNGTGDSQFVRLG